jgi:membrane protease YdiL (CAAX protease family)
VPYVLWTSSLFAAIHWEQGIPGLIAAGTLGIVAAVMYTRILNVWPFIAAHFLVNAWSFPWL